MRIKMLIMVAALLLGSAACVKQEAPMAQPETNVPAATNVSGSNVCQPEDRAVTECSIALVPVCGVFDEEKIICVKEPCEKTYNNACEACRDPLVKEWRDNYCHETGGQYKLK